MMEENDSKEASSRRGRVVQTVWATVTRRWIWALVAAIVIAGCMVVVFTFAPGSPETSTDLPTKVVIDRQRFILFRTALAHVSEPAAFVNPNSPQSQALKWLVYHDQIITPATVAKSNLCTSVDSPHWKLVQRYALMVLSFSMNGDNWRAIVPWEEHVNTDECSGDFQGVECDYALGHVTGIQLRDRLVAGHIPEEIGLLTHLTNLAVSRNLLEGRVPHSVYSRLTKLETLDLSHNEIAFHLHIDLGNLTKLKKLQLGNTLVSGSLPTAIVNLTNLKELDISNTRLEGRFLYGMKSWHKLEILNTLNTKGLSGTIPTEVGNLSNLRTLMLQFATISGTIPSEIGRLASLVTLMLGGELNGTLPSEIGHCTELRAMLLSPAPGLHGSLPTTIGNLSFLSYLHISGTSLGEIIPSQLGKLTDLKTLALEKNRLEGAFPSELKNLKNLTTLRVNANNLNGTVPKEICELPAVEVLMDCTGELVCESHCCPKGWCSD